MFRSLFLFRRLLATTFLVVFVNVFVGQCWCATVAPATKKTAAAVLRKPSYPGCHGHGATAKAKPGKTGQPHKSAGSHACCKDKSASLLAALSTPAHKQVVAPVPALLPAATDYFFRPAAGTWNRTATVALAAPRQLKPKIPDLRIFIQSLTV